MSFGGKIFTVLVLVFTDNKLILIKGKINIIHSYIYKILNKQLG
jgi:hypothetical protein